MPTIWRNSWQKWFMLLVVPYEKRFARSFATCRKLKTNNNDETYTCIHCQMSLASQPVSKPLSEFTDCTSGIVNQSVLAISNNPKSRNQ